MIDLEADNIQQSDFVCPNCNSELEYNARYMYCRNCVTNYKKEPILFKLREA